jgi:hypothetical protein
VDHCVYNYSDTEVSETEKNKFLEFIEIYTCMVNTVDLEDRSPYLLSPTHLFQMQYIPYFNGSRSVEAELRNCGADNSWVGFIMNSTTYDKVIEKRDPFREIAQNLELTETKYNVVVSVALLFGLAASMYLPVVMFPSFTKQVLCYRSGVYPSLGDRHLFPYLRKRLDSVTALFPASFWGSIITSVSFMIIGAGLVLVFILGPASFIASWLLGTVLSIAAVMAIKIPVMKIMRKLLFRNYYRTNVAGANILFIVLESWNVALMLAFMTARAINFLVIGILFIARFDTPYLAPGVGEIGPLKLDKYPFSFQCDLLLHEAHRHPFLELFGVICLVKLRCGDSFGSRAAAPLRTLAVLNLMPWLKKYRVHKGEDDDSDTGDFDNIGAKSGDGVIGGVENYLELLVKNADLEVALSELAEKLRKANEKIKKLTK